MSESDIVKATARVAMSHVAGVDLAHALVARVASDRQIRALLIKGPIATRYGLRRERASADVDVLVEPGRTAALHRALVSRGWHRPVDRSVPRILEAHSVTFVHDEWPCAIDVHSSFPGMFGDPHATFEAMWMGRVSFDLANQGVLAPSRAGMALLLALHSLRSPDEPRSRAELPQLIEAVRTDFNQSDLDELIQLVHVGRSQWVLRDFLAEAADASLADDLSDSEKDAWRLNQLPGIEKSAYLWRQEAALALRQFRFDRLWRAVWVRRADVPRSLVSELPSRSEHLRYQVDRWRRATEILGRRWGS